MLTIWKIDNAGNATNNDIKETLKPFQGEFKNKDSEVHGLWLNGQHPDGLIITGIEPNAAPGVLFSTKPGDALIHRSLGTHYNDKAIHMALHASLEFATVGKNLPNIISIHHSNDVNTRLFQGEIDDGKAKDFLNTSLSQTVMDMREKSIAPNLIHKQAVIDDHAAISKNSNVQQAIKNKNTVVTSLLANHTDGTLEFYDEETDSFRKIEPPAL